MYARQTNRIFLLLVLIASCPAIAAENGNDKVSDAVAVVQQVGPDGQGHEAAVEAMKILNAASPDQIPVILEGMDDENKLAVNWLRSAVVRIADDQTAIPMARIQQYFENKQGSHLGRLLAFDLLTEKDQELRDSLIPTLLEDPSLPLRYMAIANLIEKAEDAEMVQSVGMLGVALDKARDVNQVINIAQRLNDKGVAVDLQKQLGFVGNWNLVGNFENTNESGFDIAYGPEKNAQEIDLEATYDDAAGGEGKWKPFNTNDSQGLVDLNDVIGKDKDAIVYAHATYDSESEQIADIRIGCINAHKVWVNGELVMSNEIYHNGISPDKFIGKAKLNKGSNDILVKVCQNNQTEPWAQRWQFQLRVCDETGKAFSVQGNEESAE